MARELAYIERADLIDTADAIREQLGTTQKYGISDFGDAIRSIENAATPEYDTPTISVSTGGLITASANGKSATQQLTTQAAKTVTPSESTQTAVAASRYTTGAVTVGAISTTYVGSGVTRQAAKSVTPTTSSQTAVASGVYTTGAVTVNPIPSNYIVPSGSQTLTENKTYDVTSLASVTVNVSGGTTPTGEKNITENGTYDVTDYASAKVLTPQFKVNSSTKSPGSASTTWTITGLSGQPIHFSFNCASNITAGSTRYAVAGEGYWNGSAYSTRVQYTYKSGNNAYVYQSASYLTATYSNGTLTLKTSSTSNGGNFYNSNYQFIYTYLAEGTMPSTVVGDETDIADSFHDEETNDYGFGEG